MREFPSHLTPQDVNKFPSIARDINLSYLRRDLYEHIISKKPEEYFSIEQFNQRVNNMQESLQLVKTVIPELEKLGWTCKLSYGDTALFIFSGKPPANYWESDI
jgi:hypothetical protein